MPDVADDENGPFCESCPNFAANWWIPENGPPNAEKFIMTIYDFFSISSIKTYTNCTELYLGDSKLYTQTQRQLLNALYIYILTTPNSK